MDVYYNYLLISNSTQRVPVQIQKEGRATNINQNELLKLPSASQKKHLQKINVHSDNLHLNLAENVDPIKQTCKKKKKFYFLFTGIWL